MNAHRTTTPQTMLITQVPHAGQTKAEAPAAEYKHLFITVMNNSGSNVLKKYLDKCTCIATLDSEGHQLLDGSIAPIPWELGAGRIFSEKASLFEDTGCYNWQEIKRIWMTEWEKDSRFSQGGVILLEKSPPNIFRAGLLEKEFPRSHFIIMVRNPYAVTEGISRRKRYSLARCIQHWVRCTRKQIENINTLQNVVWFTYEDLCSNPESIQKKIAGFLPELHDLQFADNIAVHSLDGNGAKPLQNFNDKQIRNLSPAAIEIINSCLKDNLDIMEFFGYQMIPPGRSERATDVPTIPQGITNPSSTSAPEQKKHSFVFISGLHKSGTSILFRVLRNQYLFSGFSDTGMPQDEGQFLQSVYQPARAFGGVGRFGFNQAARLDERSPLVTPANRQRLFTEWSRHWNVNKQYLLEKSPPNLIRTRFLQAMFPESFFITIMRHPIAVSFATMKWYNTTLDSLFAHWLVCHSIFIKDQEALGNVKTLRYESFACEPDKTLQGIATFLKTDLRLPDDIQVKNSVNESYFEMWEALSVKTRLIHKYEDLFNNFGYSLIEYR